MTRPASVDVNSKGAQLTSGPIKILAGVHHLSMRVGGSRLLTPAQKLGAHRGSHF